MYFYIFDTSLFTGTIVLLLFLTNLSSVNSQFILTTLTITQNGQSFTVPYNKSLLSPPTNYAYFIQSGTINRPEFYLKHDPASTTLDLTQMTINFLIQGLTNMTVVQFLQVKIMISAYSSDTFTLTIISTTPSTPATLQLPVAYNPAAIIKDLQVKVFVLNIPMTHTQTLNSTHLSISPTKTPTNAISKISFSVLIITRNFVSYHVGLLIDDLKLGNLGWVIVFNNDFFFDPSQNTMLVGITSYAATTNPVFDVQDGADYNFGFPLSPDKRSIFVHYDIDTLPLPTVMNVGLFLFSQIFTGCPDNGFLTYTQLYYDSPLSCMPCHITCTTCTTANYSLSMTDEFSCLTCGTLKYFVESVNGSGIGQCKCYPGLDVNNVTQQCLPCTNNCFGFTINFMRSSTQSEFLLKFGSLADLLIPMSQNLKIYINSTTSASFTVQQMKPNFYKIIVPPQDMTTCNTKCLIKFEFSSPWKVLKQGKNQALSQTFQTLEVQNYYVFGDKIPQQLNQAFTMSSMLVGAAAGGGLSSMLKMLFEIQQMIEFHKYLNIEMPLIFKEFIESLSIFKFLDITTMFPFDIDEVMQNMSTSEFNTKGPIKAVYYEYGVNFYKNIIPVVISFALVLLINFILFFVFRLIPCKLFWKFSQKLRVRVLITFNDLIETMIIPVMVFAHFQLSVVYYLIDIIWIYAMTMAMVFFILFIPFYIITHVYMNQHNKQMKQVYQDLLVDCHINRPATYAFFLIAYYRKVLFGLSLIYWIPGMIQGFCVLTVNVIYLGFILFVVSKKIFNSKLKMLTKTLNVLCVIGIEAVMIYYNYQTHSIETMLDLGASCVYLAIIATIAGVFQAFIKIFQIVFQNVKDIQSDKQVNIQDSLKILNKLQRKQSILQKAFTKPIYSNIGKNHSFQPFQSKDSLQTASEQTKDKGKVSVLNRVRNKLGFLANLNRKNQKNSKSPKNQNVQGDSFEQMMQKIDADNLMGLESTDDLGYSIRKKETIKNRVGQSKTNLKSKQSYNPQLNDREPSNNKLQRANTLIPQPPRPKQQKNIDEQIQAIQQRMRQKRNNKKKESQSPGKNKKRDMQTIQQQENRRNENNNRRQTKRQNTNNEPTTQRVKNQQKDEKLMQNINEKKTARRRTNRQVDSLRIRQNGNKKKGNQQQQDDDDIYYVR